MYATIDCLSSSLSWCQAPIWAQELNIKIQSVPHMKHITLPLQRPAV
jgi:hypothetical protein